ncbi:hypothetical protein [Brevundimonas naejangsanensis]|uniref:hypothetical protein n=1 Tax=Brevundimonas naejangsanensis TaxID=588932 RepID=UPI0026EF05E6|nr:hypothetical protein [Brevundimonas naejangsanensis]
MSLAELDRLIVGWDYGARGMTVMLWRLRADGVLELIDETTAYEAGPPQELQQPDTA